ncbi:MAG: ABC transporter permease [Alphaproteobacteria bacterium]|nr:ABC transporter permease [Alphaproteobacteria bacterium]
MSFRTPSTTRPYAPGFTIDNYARALTDSFYLELLGDTVRLAVMITALCLVIAYPAAYHLARTTSRWRGVLYALVLSPLLVGVVIRSFGWIILLANNGLINQMLRALELPALPLMYNEFGVVLALVHVFLPFMVLPLMGAIQGIDPRLEEAARSLGASRTKVFRRVVLPLSMPGVQSGCILVFVLSCGAYVTPALLGAGRVHTLTTEVVTMLDQFLWPRGAALALILASAGLIAVWLWAHFSGRTMRGLA